ncbi:hypothetical protein GCK72_014383 [Caenorhabditis remanei]|uniref:NTF2 domain-containing protein n=1 Tax=Caenorhabditis remanei TaxID=31234 RepID=A0A6A5GTK6_CAERE|nr:hypothetical protein GCK72_014383 [Caenorhabditis remanei]KAF1757926.1 hypothetical protein GCK72_014383 [Caenorhabditis remanei]
MQITSTLTQNKMEPINGNLSVAAAPIEPLTVYAAEQVGGAFCHHFYITVSENRASITKFYGHESKFYMEDQTVTGSQEIANLYNHLPESTHFKIHCIKGYPSPHKQGVIVNVIGTVNLRPFMQTFLLGQQGQKKYYVETDAFQYLDGYFDFNIEQEKTVSPTGVNGNSNGSNGKVTKAIKTPEQPKEQPKPAAPKQQTPKKAEETSRPAKQDSPKASEKEVVRTPQKPETVQHPQQQQPRAQAPPQAPVPAPEPVQEQPKAPKTWANLVGGGAKQQPPQQQSYGQGQQAHQQQMHQMQQVAALHQQQQAQAQIYQQQRHAQQSSQHPANDLRQAQENSDASLNERKIYLGGITREIVPSNTAQAETEIKQVFYKFGEVEEVRMPRKVLDSPNDTSKHAFAFITMRNKAGVQAIFAAATRDEQGTWKLPLKLDAFGFEGHAQISEQRDQPGGGFRGGRGGFQPRGGQFFRRGGPGGAPRGGLRGAFQNGGQH